MASSQTNRILRCSLQAASHINTNSLSIPSNPLSPYICTRCLHLTPKYASGHNRWSKIKHDKAGVDHKRTVLRGALAQGIQHASKLYGANPNDNPRLASLLIVARKSGVPKGVMEAAINRGQGISESGAALEKVTIEAMMPPSIAFVVDIETDNKHRTLPVVRSIMKKSGATVTPTAYLFQRRGRLVFDKDERSLGIDEVLEDAIEAGAEDVDLDDAGNIVVWTDPSAIKLAAETLSQRLKLPAISSDILWSPNEDTIAPVDSEETYNAISSMMEQLDDIPGLTAYTNMAQGEVDDESWVELREKFAT